jgi:hypothetical protein
MKTATVPALLVLIFLLASAPQANAQHATMSDEELMADLKGAAPQNVVEHATIMNMGSDNKMKVIREGNNGWTCMDPGGAPMCADKAAMEWAKAWQEKGPPPEKTGFIYMLKGDAGASNTDPFAKEEAADTSFRPSPPGTAIFGTACYQYEAVPVFDFDDQLRHERTVPLRFVGGHRRSDRQLQHGGVLTFAQLGQ